MSMLEIRPGRVENTPLVDVATVLVIFPKIDTTIIRIDVNHLNEIQHLPRWKNVSSVTNEFHLKISNIMSNVVHLLHHQHQGNPNTHVFNGTQHRLEYGLISHCFFIFFSSSHEITLGKDSSHTIPCRFKHNYCIPCLEKKAQQHIQSNSIPVCHSDLCDYELSRYEVACLPIDATLIERLLACVRTEQKPQCPICQYYVEFKTMNDYREHVGRCEIKETMFCESCHCPIVLTQLDNHEKTCEKLPPRERLQKLVDFILPRTKYPLEVFQLRYFIEHRRADRFPIDPPSIVNALAQFGGTFPYDIPMMTCGLCGDNFIHDDIFVFGCDQSHKMCYPCFSRSCEIKMRDNAILTCAECAYQLTDGEIKQLRLSDEEITAYRRYQLEKTFNTYTTGTQGVVRCPNQECKWVAEVADPNERFQVTCDSCQSQFCSICNGQYHFRTTCQEVPEITQRWFHWCQTGRENYWRTKAQQNENFRTQLAEFEQQRNATAQRNEELRQRYNELIADENYKAQNCRLCPNCRRIVQKLEGCDAMICGRNYHGGDDQSGCGQEFRWSQAQPYVPINTGPAEVQFDMIAPEQNEVIVHEGVQYVFLPISL